jgi:hypothetical protein
MTVRLDQAVEAVFEADRLAVPVRGGFHRRANHRVQSRRVTPAGQDAYAIDFGGSHSDEYIARRR